MDISKLKRNPEKVKSALSQKSDKLITLSGCSIYFPAAYTNRDLAQLSGEVSVVGIFMITPDDTNYAVSISTAKLPTKPDSIEFLAIDEVEFIKFSYSKGSTVFESIQSVRDGKFADNIMNFFHNYNNTPFFISYEDYAEILVNTGYYNGITLTKSRAASDVLSAHLCRDPNNIKTFYRHYIENKNQIKQSPRFISLRDITSNTTSNLARVTGSELKRGLRAALNAEPTRPESLEATFLE